MAKKVSYDFSGQSPDTEAVRLWESYQSSTGNDIETRRRLAFVGDLIPKLEAEGYSQDALRTIANSIMETGEVPEELDDRPAPAAPTSLEQQATAAPAPQQELGYWAGRVAGLQQDLGEIGGVVDALQAGGLRDLGNVTSRLLRSDNPLAQVLARGVTAQAALASGNLDEYIAQSGGGGDPYASVSAIRERAAANAEEAGRVLDPIIEGGGLEGFVARTASDAAGSGISSAASLVGGPVGSAAAFVPTYAASYEEAKANGMSDEQAEAFANAQGAIEAGFSFIPAGKVINKIPGVRAVKEAIAAPFESGAARATKTLLGEFLEEAGTTVSQSLAASAGAGLAQSMGQEEFAKFQEQQADVANLPENALRAGLAGVAMAGPVATADVVQAAGEATQLDEANTKETLGALLANREAAAPITPGTDAIAVPPVAEQQADLFGTPDNLPSVEEQEAQRQRELETDAAYNIRRNQQGAETQQQRRAELRDSITRRIDTAQDRVDTLRDQVEGGDTSSATLNSLAAAQRDLQTAQGDLSTYDSNFAQQEEVPSEPAVSAVEPEQSDLFASARVAGINQVAARRKALAEQRAKAEAKKSAAEKAADRKRRNELTDRIMLENPTLSDAEVHDRVEQEFYKQATQPAAASVPPISAQEVQGPERPAIIPPVDRTAQQPAAPAPSAAPAAPQPKPDLRTIFREQTGRDVPDADESLAMEASAIPAQNTQDFVKRAVGVVKDLSTRARKGQKDAEGVQRLIRQGKLIVTDNAASIGRNDTGAASFDPKTGKMYVYLDHVGDESSVPAIISAIHEATHAGQYNDRAGRSSVLRHIMGNDGMDRINNLINTAANNGNKIAIRAIERATAAAEKAAAERGEEAGAAVGRLEIAPYFVGVARAAREGTLGSLRGVATDIVAAGRSFVRNNLGVDLDINMADIEAAIKDITNEIADTDITPANAPSADMIAGRNAVNAARAEAEGRLYQIPGHPDSKPRWEFPDNEAELLPDNLRQALEMSSANRPASMPLDEGINHARLFEEYPQLRDYTLEVADLGPATMGQFDRRRKKIVLNRNILQEAINNPKEISPASKDLLISNSEFARNVILHEIQHAVQNIEGFTGGASYNKGMVDKARNNRNDAMQTYNDYITNWADILPDVVRSLPQEQQEAWNDLLADSPSLSPVGQARMFLEYGFPENSAVSRYKMSARRFAEIDAKKNAAHKAYVDAKQLADRTYYDVHGEVEARNTEFRSRMDQEALDRLPPLSTYEAAGTPVANVRPENGDAVVQSVNPEALDMAATPETADQLSKLPPKEKVFRILRHQTNSRAADIQTAEQLYNRIRKSINKMARVNNLEVADIEADVNKMLKNVDGLEGAAKDQAWNDFSAKYPDIAPQVRQARQMIDQNTLDIIQTRLDDPRPLTPVEDKHLRDLYENLGKYVHRSYAAFEGKTGKEFAATRMKALDEAMKTLSKGGEIPAKNKEHYEAARDAIAYISSKLSIPDAATIGETKMEVLEDLYTTWVNPLSHLQYDPSGSNPSANKKAALVEALNARRDSVTPEEIAKEARRVAEDIIGITDGRTVFGKSFSGLTADTGVMKKRENIPPEIRKFLGEYKDPASRVLTTLAKQAGFLARARALAEVKERGTGTLVVSQQDARKPGNEQFSERLAGPEFGALDGWYATPEVAAKLRTMTTIQHSWEQAAESFGENPDMLVNKVVTTALRTSGKLSRRAKMMTVMANPYKWARNFAGSPLLLIKDGNFNPVSYGKAIAGSRDYLANTITGNVTQRLDNYTRYLGLESARVGEIQRIMGSTLEDVIKGREGASSAFRHGLQKLGHLTVGGYALADAWTKIANFENRVSLLKSVYGDTRTNEEIMQEAGDDINYTNISYDRASGLVKGAEKIGLSQYAPYFYEVYRTTLTGYVQAYRDVMRAASDPSIPENGRATLAAAGIMRAAGNTLVTFGAPFALSAMGAALAGGEDDNWRRNLISEFNRNQDLIHFGNNADGLPVFLPASMIDPVGPVTDMFRTWMYTEGSEADKALAVANQMKEMYISPAWASRVIGAITRTTQPDPRLARMAPDTYDQLVRSLETAGQSIGIESDTTRSATNRLTYASESWLPDWLKRFDPRTQPNLEGNFSAQQLSWMGAQFETLNPSARLAEAEFAIRDQRSQALNGVNVLLSNSPDLTQNEVKNALTSFRREEMDRLGKIYNMRVTLEKWGLDEAGVKAELKGAGFGKADIQAIYEADPKVRLSLQSMTQYLENKGKRAAGPEQARREEIMKENVDKLKASREWLASLGIVLER